MAGRRVLCPLCSFADDAQLVELDPFGDINKYLAREFGKKLTSAEVTK